MNASQLAQSHTRSAIRRRLSAPPSPSYLRDFIYGGIDGAITTFAIVAGSVGADLGTRTILILGLSNLVADGLSMAASNYSATKAEVDHYTHVAAEESHQIDTVPDGEREEVRQLLERKGLAGDTLSEATEAITSIRQRWIDFMMSEEHGLALSTRTPMRAAAATFAAFVVCGSISLIPFLIATQKPFEASLMLTACVFFGIGSWKSRWSVMPWWRSGLETLAIGSGAAIVAFAIGNGLKNII